jgi:putative phosphoribosyl transferase
MISEIDNLVDIPELRNIVNIFNDREHAGLVLSEILSLYKNTNSIVFGIPAGGVPVAASLATKLNLKLDLAVVSKITLPWNTEAGYGAVAFDGSVLLNDKVLVGQGLTEMEIKNGIEKTSKKVQMRYKKLRGDKPFPNIKNIDSILVDDGIASGFTMLAAIHALKSLGSKDIIVAVPTAHLKSLEIISPEVEKIYCANVRDGLGFAVASAYKNWRDVDETELNKYLTSDSDDK